jgi:deoxyribodipyrimidine photolyase-related protein
MRLFFVLGDQLSHTLPALKAMRAGTDVIWMAELRSEAQRVRHHKKKLVFIFSAMRHFAQELIAMGHTVQYTDYSDVDNAGSFTGELRRALDSGDFTEVHYTEPSEYAVAQEWLQCEHAFSIDFVRHSDQRFLASKKDFQDWSRGKKQLRMEFFYREMRRRYQVLMEQDQPIGGQWNYDAQNRKPPKRGLKIPAPYAIQPDAITQTVVHLVAEEFTDHFGHVEPFSYAVTAEEARDALEKFIVERLSQFGDYQDAMLQGEAWMYHSHIALYLNCGLLLPMECIRAAECAYQEGAAPLNAVEGFIRQILGWREFVRGLYWQRMPAYAEANYFDAQRALPDFFWTGTTDMNCLHQCITETERHAYAHHIQRLMVLGNFCLLCGIQPQAVNEWFWVVYADAYEWVELPNVSGMALFADGGLLASKPYAASGAYINKMSNYCKNCRYSPSQKNGANACPFNYLYWDFLQREAPKLQKNPRMGMPYRTLSKMSPERLQAVAQDSREFFTQLDQFTTPPLQTTLL